MTGSPPWPPDLLLKAVLLEMQRGEHALARWYRDAQEHGPLRWLLGGQCPAARTSTPFATAWAPWLVDLNRQVLAPIPTPIDAPSTSVFVCILR